jgi:cytochrome c556
MKAGIMMSIIVITSLVAGPDYADAAEPRASSREVKLSPELVNLLRAEMREISAGVQGIAVSIAAADWKSIQESSAKIRLSYIMEKKLTPAQAAELEKSLPQQFKQLDANFHLRAGKVGAAAAAHDAELVTFQYYRLLESCTVCHSEFAKSRFPGFSSVAQQVHHH